MLRQIAAVGWHRMLIAFLAIWLLILVLTAFPMLNTNVTNYEVRTAQRLSRALLDLEVLRKQNEELQDLFRDIRINDDQKEAIENFQKRLTKADQYRKQDLGYISQKSEPNTNYELLRRRIYTNSKEFWNYLHSNFVEIQKKASDIAPDVVDLVNQVLKLGIEHKRSLLHDIEEIAEVDGYKEWREQEFHNLSNLVQTRFKNLQNPKDCSIARKLVCSLNKGCGYGCQLHHAVYCFMVAYGTKRTMVLKSKGWRYHRTGWEDIFKPLSETCTTPDGESISNWPGNLETQVLNLPIIDSLSPRPPFLPLAIPEDLAPRLIRLHGDPIVWWIGQILKYLLRPQQKTAAMIEETMTKMGFQKPIVGVHIRRTDKVGTEAAFHKLEEYMVEVDEYFNQLQIQQPIDKRRVYLASDDPKVLNEARLKYPHYDIIGDPQISKTASISSRYSDVSLSGIILDIHMLSMTDYLVCTFSSQVCRVAYEIMQTYHPDASGRFRSLDDIYYYGGQNPHNVVAVLSHEPQKHGEMIVNKGDIIGVAGNHWNGYSKGRNLRTNQIGLYPSFKTKDKIETAKFPTYSEFVSQSHKNIDQK
ncbi:alpha-(1,6)-fucosyltransferase isoform X2 [Cylas formicarius]|uniref:alpha-(1,6)-fucosyltransferase isoform X2 n=1 Tax=Cylas formicarius TaxID=197179 RepID=UPI002958872D|nr:alpha-(1,6)-fucosyltransferase isoform X2 [Cylas formicarius]